MQKGKGPFIQIRSLALCLLIGLVACRAEPAPAEIQLVLEQYPLEGPPDADGLVFQPIGTTQEIVLEKRQAAREKTISNPVYTISGDVSPRLNSLGPGQELTAVVQPSQTEPSRQSITVFKEEEISFNVDAGLPSPALPLQSLWTYEGHWVLEVLYAEGETWQGRIYRDGISLNQELDYQETFGFQLLAGKPFYFFQRDGELGYFYDQEENSLPYEHILHYGCCSAAALNPVPAENMVAFYAFTDTDWFYVELGIFNQD